MIKFIDAFAGVGGFHLGIKNSNVDSKCVCAIEINKDARNIYTKNFNMKPIEDITKININNLPEHDLLCGGFPCQPFSRNGKYYNKNNKKLDSSDKRVNLSHRLFEILDVHQPKYFIFENVKEIMTIKNEDGSLFIDIFNENLTNCGYDVNTLMLNTADFGLAQQRKRIFFIGIRKDIKQIFNFSNSNYESVNVDDFIDNDVDAKYFIMNLWKNRKILLRNPDKKNHDFNIGDCRNDALKQIYEKSTQPNVNTNKITPMAILYGDTPSGLPRQQDKIYSKLGISPTIATFSTPAFDFGNNFNEFRVLTPRECFRLQGFDNNFIIDDRDVIAYKHAGNSVSPKIVERIVKCLIKK